MIRPYPPDYDVVLVVRNPQRPGMIGRLLTVVGDEGGLIGDIETRFVGKDHLFREVTISVYDDEHLQQILRAIEERTEADVLEVKDLVFSRHEGGKIRTGRTRN
ncbi:MAG TPA: hypothetical protein VD962_09270, partial [Rubricoccaceae bacterium]|nr:hypothetical protein [Rubricoccaceae bacterium]